MSNNNLSEISGTPTVFNISGLDIDFIVSGVSDNSPKYLFYDASTGRLGLNTNLPDSALHIVAPCANDGLKIEGTTNCATGVKLLLQHNPGTSPETGSYPATIDFAGRDTNGSLINYAQIRSKVLSPLTSGTSGELLFRVDYRNSLYDIFKANINNIVLGGQNEIDGESYNVIGADNSLSGLLYINLGSNNEGTVHSGLLLGNNILVNSEDVVCVSNDAVVDGDRIVIFGNRVSVTGDNSIVIANNSNVDSNNSVLIGNNVNLRSNSHNNLLVLHSGNISGLSGIGFGSFIMVTGNSNLFFGHNVRVTGSDNSAIGSSSFITGNNNISYGSRANISGSNIVSLGTNNILSSVSSGMFIGHDVSLTDSVKTIIMGLNNSANKELNNSILIGIDNTTSMGEAQDIIFVGQKNVSSNIKNSLIIGNKNNLSGTINTNIVVGPDNYSALSSNNNVIIGGLNNNSGLGINTQGSISGNPARASSLLNNSNIIGINNLALSVVNASLFGNKNIVSGNNLNSFGSFNNLKNVSNIQNIGNSNVIYGNNNNVFGSKVTLIGNNSIVNNPSERTAYVFGSGSVFFGDNKIVVGGVCVGDRNDIHGENNIVYGSRNILGSAYNKASLSSANTSVIEVLGDVRSVYKEGEKILILVYHPMSTVSSFIRTISTDGVSYSAGFNRTSINITESITVNGSAYGRKENFDDDLVEKNTLTIECIILPYAIVDPLDSVEKFYGKDNLVLGTSNKYLYDKGLILGNSNNITGTNNTIIGNNISGTFNNSLQIGTSNNNKIYLDDINIIFNTGSLQENIYVRSRGSVGTDNIALRLNLSTNRLGINNNNPRSSLDVSGTLTTNGLRVGLSSIPGYSLISDSNGNATWQFPVNLSGLNSGLLYKVNDKVASGSEVLLFNNSNKTFNYIYTIESSDPFSSDPVSYVGASFSRSGLYLNDTVDFDSTYNIKIYGTGIGTIETFNQSNNINGDRIILLETLPNINGLRVFNVSGASGHFWRHSVTDKMFLPVSLSGTFLRVNGQNGELDKFVTNPNSILFSDSLSQQTGNNLLKFYNLSSNSVLTIGATGLTVNEATTFSSLAADTKSNIILSSSATHGTVFNNAGNSNQLFSLYNFGAASTREGFHYDHASGVLGIGIADNYSVPSGLGTSSLLWKNHPVKLFVNGRIRTHGLQFLVDGQFDQNPSNTYLRVDSNGNVFRGGLDLNAQFSGVWPIYTQSVGNRLDVGLSTNIDSSAGSANLSAANNGSLLVWNGSAWRNNARGMTLFQPAVNITNPNSIYGPIIGANTAGYSNTVTNSITFAGGPFRQTDGVVSPGYFGSNQDSKHFLKGRTIGSSNQELVSNFDKQLSTIIETNNTISIANYFNVAAVANPISRSGELGIWNYTVNYCGLIAPVSEGQEIVPSTNWNAVAGKIEGSVLFYNKSGEGLQAIKLADDSHSFRASASYIGSWTSGNPPIDVIFETGVAPQRMKILSRGIVNTNILWNCSVDIHQLNHPNTIRVSGTI